MPAMKSKDVSSAIRTVCIIGHDAISRDLMDILSKTSIHIHLVYYSSYALSHIPKPNITLHQHTSKTFTNLELLKPVLTNLSPPVDLLINTSHGGDLALQSLLMTACIETNIPRFMPAEFSLDSLNPHVQNLVPPHTERANLINLLKQTSEGDCKNRLEWIGLATGYGISNRLVDGRMGIDLTWQSATIFGTGTQTFAVSSHGFTVRAIKAVVDHWDRFSNQYLCVCGLETSFSQILAALERELSRDFEVGYSDVEEAIHMARKRIQGGWPDAGVSLLEQSVLADERCFEGFRKDRALRVELGLEEEALEALVHDIVHTFKHHGKGGCGCD